MNFHLTLCTGEEIESPTGAEIESALRSLPGGQESFAILSRSEQVYVQTSGGRDEGFVLEYRDGSQERHFRCTDPRLPLETVVRAFRAYLEGGTEFRSELEWELDAPSQGGPRRVGWIIIGVLGAFLLVFYRCLA